MTQKVVVLIRSNPKESHRAGEGIRIALGLASGEHEVEVILAEQAPLLLTADLDEYIDGEMTEKFLSTLKEFVPTFYIEEKSAKEIDLSESDYETIILSADEIAAKIAATDCFATF
jgi:sulfur relay (sulfurtransferase) DsrF/TusC family protein